MTQILCKNSLATFLQVKNGEIKMKSQKSVKGGPDGADFLHTGKIGHFKKKSSK